MLERRREIGLLLASLFVRTFSQLVMPVDFVIDPAAFVVMLVVVIAGLSTIAPTSRAAQARFAEMVRRDSAR